ncbi:MarR family transcriptional regulator [Georgenia yuyongxinii]|uniref:MarR family transcriptional regulator n=1 Tax=Georgenia yuyongxinii TaxID=2589797 RepID=A0A5B8C868_9MICO|nr:MarR family transcriptional regulator [Georgenia yuyongxinii]QDC25651.1 MarR family transcriptional regulator [Georgenia yuyongxinii]
MKTSELRRARLPRTAAGWTSTPYYLVTIGNAISWGSALGYLRRFGVGVNEWRLMAHVANEPGCTAADVSRFLRTNKAVVSRSLKTLQDKGLVGLDSADGARRIYLTEDGVALHDRILPIAVRREQILLDGLDEEERELLIGMLRRMHANLTAMNEFDHGADVEGVGVGERRG